MKKNDHYSPYFSALLILCFVVFIALAVRYRVIHEAHINNESALAIMEMRISMYNKYKEQNEIPKPIYEYNGIYELFTTYFNYWPVLPSAYSDLEKKGTIFFSDPLFFMELNLGDNRSIYCNNSLGCTLEKTLPDAYLSEILRMQQNQIDQYFIKNNSYPLADTREKMTTTMREQGFLWPIYYDQNWNYSAWSNTNSYRITAQSDKTLIVCTNSEPCSVIENK